MASVTLHEAHLHDAVDLSDYVTTDGFGGFTESETATGRVASRANGRQVLIVTPAAPWSATLTFPAVDRTTLQWLRDHKRRLVLYRDPYGRLEWGSYMQVQITERGSAAPPDASVTFQKVTYSEVV